MANQDKTQIEKKIRTRTIFHWLLIVLLVLRDQHLGFFPVFFFYAADLSLFLDTGMGLTFAVFTESVDLRSD